MDKDIVCCGANENLTNEDSISNSSSIFLIMILKLLLLFLVLSIDYTRHLRPRWQGFNFFSNHFHSASIELFTRIETNQIALFIARIKNFFYIFMAAVKAPMENNSFRPQWQHVQCVLGQFSIIKNSTVKVHRLSYHTVYTSFNPTMCCSRFQRGCIFIARLHFEWHKQCAIYTEKQKEENRIPFLTDWLAKAARGCTHTLRRQTGQTRFHLGNI